MGGGDGDEDEVPLAGRIKARLIAAKEKAARLRCPRGAAAPAAGDSARERLPPGQRVVGKWPVLDLGVTPRLDPARWHLAVDGLVAAPADWSWEEFLALPQTEVVADVHCVTGWSLYDSAWRGVAARDLIVRVIPAPEARFVLFRAHDGYTTNVPLARFAAGDVMLAHARNGEPIGPEHGGPVRAVIPGLYFWKSAKWVRRITFAADDAPGYWEVRGYHNDADPWKEERYG